MVFTGLEVAKMKRKPKSKGFFSMVELKNSRMLSTSLGSEQEHHY